MKKCVQTFDQDCTQVNEPCVFCVHEHRVGVHHETASNRGLYIVSPTMGSRMDELAVMSRWQAQSSSQVTAAHCDKFMTSACLSLSHTHSDTHAHALTHTSSDMPFGWDCGVIWGIVLISPLCVCAWPHQHSAAWEKEQMACEGSSQSNAVL